MVLNNTTTVAFYSTIFDYLNAIKEILYPVVGQQSIIIIYDAQILNSKFVHVLDVIYVQIHII